MPKISVIVPVYKVEPYIHRCVDSILSQTYEDFEMILVDDGSPDNCPAICDEYAKTDSRIHVIHQHNGGLSAARNAGIDWAFMNSDSEWITFIDSDDWVHQKYLDVLYEHAISFNSNISICNFIRTEGEEITDNLNINATVFNPEDFFLQHGTLAIISCAKLYKKSLFESVRFPYGKLYEDGFTTHLLLFAQNEVVLIDSPLYYYYQRTDSIMHQKWKPKSLYDSIDSTNKRMSFFTKNSFIKAAKVDLIRQLENYNTFHLANIKKFDNVFKRIKYSFYTRTYIKLLFLKYKKRLNITIKVDPHYYELTFPCFMWVYWRIMAFKRKLQG